MATEENTEPEDEKEFDEETEDEYDEDEESEEDEEGEEEEEDEEDDDDMEFYMETEMTPFKARYLEWKQQAPIQPKNWWIVYQPCIDPDKEKKCPLPVPLSLYSKRNVEPAPELIHGLLRGGEKMLLTGASKSGKSFLLMELALALATGRSWLGFPCEKTHVLYLNVEMEDMAAAWRIKKICEQWDIDMSSINRLSMRTITGKGMNLRRLRRYLEGLNEEKELVYDVIIIDPIYKLLEGDENSSTTINQLTDLTDWICQELNMTVIYSHHHSKGSKGSTRAMDRSSGSGIFARDADALVDLIELEVPPEVREKPDNKDITAFRMEAVLRDYPRFEPINLFFRYPVHELDTEGILAETGIAGVPRSNLNKSSKRVSEKDRKASVKKAYEKLNKDGRPVAIKALAKEIGVSERCTRDRLKELTEEFWVEAGLVGRIAG